MNLLTGVTEIDALVWVFGLMCLYGLQGAIASMWADPPMGRRRGRRASHDRKPLGTNVPSKPLRTLSSTDWVNR